MGEDPLKVSRARGRIGLPPGSLVYLGEEKVEQVRVSVIDYNETELNETAVGYADECSKFIKRDSVTWINVTGLHDTELLAGLGDVFGLHPLVLEDILHLGQRPKLEDHDDYVFCTLQMLYRRPGEQSIVSEQVSMVLGKGYLLTFQEMDGDVFDMIRERIRTGKGRIRKMGCDYLAYALIDAIVDNYFVVLEEIGEKSEALQESVLEKPEPATLQTIHRVRRELIGLRKYLWPLREVVSNLEKTESRLISKGMGPYLRDVYEHTIQVIDSIESLRDVLSGALDTYMTVVSNRTNDVMKVLTIIATIFIPLTFVAGIYGMNFENMPELKWQYGYAGVWVVMVLLTTAMFAYFRRKKWL